MRPFLGPRGSSSERLKQLWAFGSSGSERLRFGVSAGRYWVEPEAACGLGFWARAGGRSSGPADPVAP
eukprot:12984982-Alexandrium_andersonii.AAC.1